MRHLLTITLSLLILSSCEDSGVSANRGAFSITSCEKLNAEYPDFAKIKLTAKNNSKYHGGCWAYIKIKKGNTIIETGTVVFSDLNPGESQIVEAWFNKFSKHSEYDKAVVTLNWTIDSVGYSNEYTY